MSGEPKYAYITRAQIWTHYKAGGIWRRQSDGQLLKMRISPAHGTVRVAAVNKPEDRGDDDDNPNTWGTSYEESYTAHEFAPMSADGRYVDPASIVGVAPPVPRFRPLSTEAVVDGLWMTRSYSYGQLARRTSDDMLLWTYVDLQSLKKTSDVRTLSPAAEFCPVGRDLMPVDWSTRLPAQKEKTMTQNVKNDAKPSDQPSTGARIVSRAVDNLKEGIVRAPVEAAIERTHRWLVDFFLGDGRSMTAEQQSTLRAHVESRLRTGYGQAVVGVVASGACALGAAIAPGKAKLFDGVSIEAGNRAATLVVKEAGGDLVGVAGGLMTHVGELLRGVEQADRARQLLEAGGDPLATLQQMIAAPAEVK